MAGRSSSPAGPKQVTEFIKPYYRRIRDMPRPRGAGLFAQDSDGNTDVIRDLRSSPGLVAGAGGNLF